MPLALLRAAALAATVLAGPPWISIELPANPMDPAARGAYLLVHTYHHREITNEMVRGRAVGVVHGERRTVELSFDRTETPGVLALKRTWPAEGAWVLAISVGPEHGTATALVRIAEDGSVRGVEVPTEMRNGYLLPKQVSDADVDAALGTLASR
jgi:hypothetical protein